MTNKQYKPLGTFSLVMINIIAIDNLRTLPFAASFGLSLITIYLIASLIFLIPIGFVSAELATTFPDEGGIYVWIKKAFGRKISFFIIWLQWIYNVVWYPTILAFILAMLAHGFNIDFLQNKTIFLSSIILLFWFATFINSFGMEVSGKISNLCAIIGTLTPMALMIVLGFFWIYNNNLSHLDINWQNIIPKSNSENLPFLVEVIFGLVGLEMSAMHANQVQNPEKSFPKAIFWSTLIIILSLSFSSLSVAIVIPHQELSLLTGISQSLKIFLLNNNLQQLYPVMIILIIIGSIGSIAAWIIGPTKGLLIAANDKAMPQYFTKLNKHKVPTRILVLQAIIVTILAGFYIWLPSLENAYIMLTAMTTQLSLIVYIGLFLAALKLRKTFPHIKRPYKIPFNNYGITLCCIIGSITCLSVIILGFFPPPDIIKTATTNQYLTTIAIGMIILCTLPFIIYNKTTSA